MLGKRGKKTDSEVNGIRIFLNWPKVTRQALDNQLRLSKEASSLPQQNRSEPLTLSHSHLHIDHIYVLL